MLQNGHTRFNISGSRAVNPENSKLFKLLPKRKTLLNSSSGHKYQL